MNDPKQKPFACADCGALLQKQGAINCATAPDRDVPHPANCPSEHQLEVIEAAFRKYTGDDEDARLARVAAQVEGLGYQKTPESDIVCARWTRVEDTVALATLMGYKKIGIATCIGLLTETARLADILRAQGFEPISICCKSGSIDKLKLGLREDEKVRPGTFEAACNPIAQAQLLNQSGTDMNILVGLCVGHDMLFTKYSDAPVTTLVAKDRVTGHNPVAVLYGQNHYYKRLQKLPVMKKEG